MGLFASMREHSAETYLTRGAGRSFRAERVLLAQLRAVGEVRPKQHLFPQCFHYYC